MIPYFVLESFNIGPVTLHVWGVFAGLAFAAALFIALKEALRKSVLEDDILNLAIIILVGGVAGARLLFVIENWGDYSKEPMRILNLNEGGMMFYGGAIGAMVLSILYARFKKLSFWRIADTVVPSLAIGEFIGRIGCTLTDLHIGTITAFPWGQQYIDGSVRHPIGIYMSLNGLLMLAVFWLLRLRIKAEGALFLFFLLWYSGTRFLLDFLRCGDIEACDPHYFGFTPSQYISALVFLSVLAILYARSRNTRVSKLILKLPVTILDFLEKPLKGLVPNLGYLGTNGLIRKIKFMEEEKKEEKKQVTGQAPEKQPDATSEIKAVSGNDQEDEKVARSKKIWSYVIILIIGFAVGAGLLSGYYERLFKQSLFSFRGKSWVSYDDPLVKLTVINDPKCTTCDSEAMVKFLKTNITPTLDTEEISYDSQRGKDLISKFGIKSVPAFVFGANVETLKAFKETTPDQMNQVFTKKDDQYYLNPAVVSSVAGQLGINPGKFIELPQVSASDRVKGPANAPVTIVEFSDFECEYCKTASEAVNQALAAYPEKVRFVYKHFPLSQIHPNAEYAAQSAECAGDQNKFWEMSDLLFANQEELKKQSADQYKGSINAYADRLKLNTKDFADCLSSNKYKSKVEADAKLAAEYGLGGTPAFFINDQLIGGAITSDELKSVIDQQLKGK